MHGHQGIEKTLERLTRNYFFPGMRKTVERIVTECEDCARNKASRHLPYGQLKNPDVPKRAWDSITIDFITKLPKSIEPMTGIQYDSILVIVDRLTKFAYFLPHKEECTAEDFAYIFQRTVLSNHQMPAEIISDRDKIFTSRFWRTLTALLGTNHKLSTSYHPQTDGQTERINQILEQYLRFYVDFKQDNWVQLLPMAQFAYNSAMQSTIGMSPFYANYGYNPEAYREPRPNDRQSQQATLRTENLKTLHQWLAKEIEFLNLRAAKYFDERRLKGPTLKEGDKVFLLRKHFTTKGRPSKKLDHVKIGPLEVIEVLGKGTRDPVNYRLKLPKNMRMHPVFHISLLEPAPPNAKLMKGAYEIGENEQKARYNCLVELPSWQNAYRLAVYHARIHFGTSFLYGLISEKFCQQLLLLYH
jgi:hypothetical protein